jgi:hypothetical protein
MAPSAADINLCAMRAADILGNIVFSRKRVTRADRPSSGLESTFAGHSLEISLDIVTERESAADDEKTCSFN